MNKTQFAMKAFAGLVIGASMQFAVASTFANGDISTTLNVKGSSNCSITCEPGQTASCSASGSSCECSCESSGYGNS